MPNNVMLAMAYETSFLLALIIFILKQIDENEFIILWTSGVKKLKIVNLFFYQSFLQT